MRKHIPVIWYGNPDKTEYHSWWDLTLISDILNNKVWHPAQGYEFDHFDGDGGIEDIAKGYKGAIIVIPGRHWVGKEDEIERTLRPLEWRLLIIAGQEEGNFNYRLFQNEHTKIWLMQPKPSDEADFYLGSGYTPHTRQYVNLIKYAYIDKPLDWFFAGQNTHQRRYECTAVLEKMLEREDIKGQLERVCQEVCVNRN